MKPIDRHPAGRAVLAAAIVIGAAVWALHTYASTAGTTIFLPVAQKDGVALPPEDEASARLSVPDGFAVRIFVRDLNNPRLMTIGPDGQLYVAERGAGQIIRLPDADANGLADTTVVVARNLNSPHNLEWHDGAFYVAEDDKIGKLADANGDGDFLDPGERTTVTSNIPCCGGHSSRTLHFGPDGKLYVAAGSSCNICVEDDKRRAAILRFNPDGSIPADNPFASDPEPRRRPVWAEGLRNSVDFLFMPGGQLWADHNGSDNLGTDLPPEEVVINVEKGKHYGWPFCYTPPPVGAVPAGTKEARDSRIAFAAPISSCDQATPALFTDLAHQAPLGMARYDKTIFPAAYQGNLFIAYHGSWNAPDSQRECKVQRIVVAGGKPASAEPFLTGFRDSASQVCGSAWGRPAGVVTGAHGELFVSDDQNGNVYRVVYVGI
jgi:glucose/arabinose dehydrogenase